jgi:dienelactone hydrolase
LATDTLILIGEVDYWTPVMRRKRWYDQVERAARSLQMKVYPGALHGFDAPRMPHVYAGHYAGRDPQAAADALAVSSEFLAQRLSP